MVRNFESIVRSFIRSFPCASGMSSPEMDDDSRIARSLNKAFLAALSGDPEPEASGARGFLDQVKRDSSRWANAADFYLRGIDLVKEEIGEVSGRDPEFKARLKSLSEWVSYNDLAADPVETRERLWSVFFPEAQGILENRKEKTEALRRKRTVLISELNKTPVRDPEREVLFTSNVLLTLPLPGKDPDGLHLSKGLREKLLEISHEPQLYWYDHPIHAGVEPEGNELLYGLKGLEDALEFEHGRGNSAQDGRLTCVLSLSVTHRGLHEIAKPYVEEILAGPDKLKNIDVYVFTEVDTRKVIDEVISPAADRYLKTRGSRELLKVFGVDGDYGRHYSFLKAVSAFWKIFIRPETKATFKIDLDQVFPQKELLDQTGSSAFEHLRTPLWGARGTDSGGRPLELGMIAGALVNESDIHESLFSPDVPFPESALSADEYIFFSPITQALSTEAEMMTRYGDGLLDGKKMCIQRIHVTGGTNGILVDSLRRHRPFTPSFIGRAEDQAYILSALFNRGEGLAYAHEDGLIMRHDKEVFAQEAISSSHVPKLIGDYVRILFFTAYGEAINRDINKIKDIVDPFTGCFISKIPVSVVYLKFCLKVESFFAGDEGSRAMEFLETGSKRIMTALEFVRGKKGGLKRQYKKERLGWDVYYDTLSALEKGLLNNDEFAVDMRERALEIVKGCLVSGGRHA